MDVMSYAMPLFGQYRGFAYASPRNGRGFTPPVESITLIGNGGISVFLFFSIFP